MQAPPIKCSVVEFNQVLLTSQNPCHLTFSQRNSLHHSWKLELHFHYPACPPNVLDMSSSADFLSFHLFHDQKVFSPHCHTKNLVLSHCRLSCTICYVTFTQVVLAIRSKCASVSKGKEFMCTSILIFNKMITLRTYQKKSKSNKNKVDQLEK